MSQNAVTGAVSNKLAQSDVLLAKPKIKPYELESEMS